MIAKRMIAFILIESTYRCRGPLEGKRHKMNGTPSQCVHWHLMERVVDFLSVRHQSCARRVRKVLWEAVRAASMENLLCAMVHQDTVGEDLVVVALTCEVYPFPSIDALVEWSGGMALLYEELLSRFPHAAAMGISARLAAIRPFPFASGSVVRTMGTSSAAALDSVVMGMRDAGVLFRVCYSAAHSTLCLHGATAGMYVTSFLPSLTNIKPSAFRCRPLQLLCLADFPLLESIGEYAFACSCLFRVELTDLSSLRTICPYAFFKCKSLHFVRLTNLPLLETIGEFVFSQCSLTGSAIASLFSPLAWRTCRGSRTLARAFFPGACISRR